jgi:hypothetical protein
MALSRIASHAAQIRLPHSSLRPQVQDGKREGPPAVFSSNPWKVQIYAPKVNTPKSKEAIKTHKRSAAYRGRFHVIRSGEVHHVTPGGLSGLEREDSRDTMYMYKQRAVPAFCRPDRA